MTSHDNEIKGDELMNFKRKKAAHCFIENTYINLNMENYLIILGSAKRPHSAADPFIKVAIDSA